MCSSSTFRFHSLAGGGHPPTKARRAQASCAPCLHPLLKGLPLHISRDGYLQVLQDGRGHIHQLQPSHFTPTWPLLLGWVVFDHDAILRVVAVVGPGVVLKRVDRAVTHGAHRAPVQVAKVDDQVGGTPLHSW